MIKYFLALFIAIFFISCGGGGSSSTITPTPNSVPMLGILVNYNNISISSSDTTWSNKLFGQSEHQLNHYYREVSNNLFEFTKVAESSGINNDGIISINLSKDHPNSENLYTLQVDLKNALIQADPFIDFSNYDKNADGYITSDELTLTFIFAGYEDSYEGNHVINGVWAHAYCAQSSANTPTLDAVTLMECSNSGGYVLLGEKHDIDPKYTHDATIGIIAHELGHETFKLPDLYNTSADSGGIGYFGLMGGGAWGMQINDKYPGDTPIHFSAWSKEYIGWITPTIVNGYHTMYASSSADFNIVKIPINSTSYYLLENRDNSGYDRGLFSLNENGIGYGEFNGGIAIWKIDITKLTTLDFENNTVNADTQNKGVDLVEAQYSTIDSSGSTGLENALYYNPNKVSFGSSVTNISSRGSVMSLNVN